MSTYTDSQRAAIRELKRERVMTIFRGGRIQSDSPADRFRRETLQFLVNKGWAVWINHRQIRAIDVVYTGDSSSYIVELLHKNESVGFAEVRIVIAFDGAITDTIPKGAVVTVPLNRITYPTIGK